jgi:RNA polymerase sigma factor (sigma-70 family)
LARNGFIEKATAVVSESTFENLVQKHGPQVLRTALRVLHDASLAHDVHQEVFLAIWRRWHRYNGDVNWPAYLYRATVRKALEVAQQRPVCSVPVRAYQDTPRDVTTSEPGSALQADELQQKLAAALARLPRPRPMRSSWRGWKGWRRPGSGKSWVVPSRRCASICIVPCCG